MEPEIQFEASTFVIRVAITFLFVALNGFFVAAEFALVKVRPSQLRSLAEAGSRRARVARTIHAHLDLYLSACQLGITLSSLILGWLAEPAFAELILWGATSLGIGLSPSDPLLHGFALAIALAVVTFLHMTIGEQAPKLWAIQRAAPTALQSAYPLQIFAAIFRPFIWLINESSNWMLRLAGLSSNELHESSHSVEELRGILVASAQAGHISGRQVQIAENVFGMIDLEVRHILVPRVDVVLLSLQHTPEESLAVIRESGHSRFPLCETGLDSLVGMVHAKDLLRVEPGTPPDFRAMARPPLFVPDTQPLARLIASMQRTRNHSAVVLDEHGSCVGLAFLEDALEEIVGPMLDEFDVPEDSSCELGEGAVMIPGGMALPEAANRLGLSDLGDEADTIGGYVVAGLGRLPHQGDELAVGHYRAIVADVRQRRILSLRFEPASDPAEIETQEEPEDRNVDEPGPEPVS